MRNQQLHYSRDNLSEALMPPRIRSAKQQAAEADRLRKENELLKQEGQGQEMAFAAEKRSFIETIAGLKAQLHCAFVEIKRIAARMLLLEDRLFPRVQNTPSDMEERETGSIFRP